ncbi:MAG: tyrosine-type recombinase/integrase [Bacteroidia bacterium]
MSKLTSFADYLQNERRYSQHTKTAYVNDIAQFFCFLQLQFDVSDETAVKPTMIKSWIYEQAQKKLSPRSINRKLVALNTFYKFLIRSGTVEINPMAPIQSVKTEKRLYQWLTEAETSHLFEKEYIAFAEDFAGVRDKLIMELLYGTGMRLSELISLQESSLQIKDATIKVTGKRNKERIIPIPKEVLAAVHIYRQQKMLSGFGDEKYLLLTDKGQPMYPMFVNRVVKKYISAVSSIQKNSPHVLRHTYATHLLNNGAEINAIKELLGHANLAATQIYTHNSIERLKTIYKQAHPKG